MTPEEVRFRLLRLIEERPDIAQREIAQELGISLGKVNYCLQALIEKGHVKLANFRKAPDKFKYRYLLTPRGIEAKTQQAMHFLRRKVEEYERLRGEIDALTAELDRLQTKSAKAGHEGARKPQGAA
jgi:EPS-associated MarR family transcriptional regulator